MRLLARALLVAATVVCLLSIGGAMLVGVWVLVPLHWLAARSSGGPYGVGAWTVLAAASAFEAAWMLAYVATEAVGISLAIGVGAGAGTAVLFLRRAADHHVMSPALLR